MKIAREQYIPPDISWSSRRCVGRDAGLLSVLQLGSTPDYPGLYPVGKRDNARHWEQNDQIDLVQFRVSAATRIDVYAVGP